MKQETQKLNESMGSSICEIYAQRFLSSIRWQGDGKTQSPINKE